MTHCPTPDETSPLPHETRRAGMRSDSDQLLDRTPVDDGAVDTVAVTGEEPPIELGDFGLS